MRYPSVKTLMRLTDSRPLALRIRKVLDGRDSRVFISQRGKLCEVNKILENHGVEFVKFECSDFDEPDGFEFSNTGDQYATILVLYKDRFQVTGWADMLEWHEKRCKRCVKRAST